MAGMGRSFYDEDDDDFDDRPRRRRTRYREDDDDEDFGRLSVRSNSGGRTYAKSLVMGPAITLIAFSVVYLIFLAFISLQAIDDIPAGGLAVQDASLGVLVTSAGCALMQILIIAGSVQMIRLSTRGLALSASILAWIPVVSPCCILGIPFGIWAFVVLCRPDVREAFE